MKKPSELLDEWMQQRDVLQDYLGDTGAAPYPMRKVPASEDQERHLFGRYRVQPGVFRYKDAAIARKQSFEVFPWILFADNEPVAILWLQAHGSPSKDEKLFIIEQHSISETAKIDIVQEVNYLVALKQRALVSGDLTG